MATNSDTAAPSPGMVKVHGVAAPLSVCAASTLGGSSRGSMQISGASADTHAMGIRSAGHSGAVHVRAGYDVEYKRIVTYVKEFGFQRVGYVYLKDTSQANLVAMENALQTVGVKPAAIVPIDRNAKSLEPVAKQLLDAKLDVVLFTTNAAPVLSVIEHMRDRREASSAENGPLDALSALRCPRSSA